MATGGTRSLIQHLRREVLRREETGVTDGQLLEWFVADRDAAAFEALVRRHGPMVLGVCRRILGNPHDADDAFQATFLVLARKAASVSPPEKVGNWLHGVARTTAIRAKAANAKRRLRERPARDLPEPLAVRPDCRNDLRPLLDEELARLPAKYRLLVVLCDLEGRPRKEVARQLGVPEGTLSSRLTAARRMLAKRLAGHGLAVSAGSLALAASSQASAPCLSASQGSSTVEAALRVAVGKTAAGLVPNQAALLAKGVLKMMLLSRLGSATVVLLTTILIAFGGWTLSHRAAAGRPTEEVGARTATRPAVPACAEEVSDEVMLREEPRPENYAALFDTMLEVLGEFFEIAYANRYEGRIETSHLLDKKGVRRRAILSAVTADEGGYVVSVRVFKEGIGVSGWAPLGPDTELEKRILRRVVDQYRKERTEASRQRKAGEERKESEGPGKDRPNGIRLRNVHLDAVNAERSISVVTLSGRPTNILNLPVAKDARIEVKGGKTFADLKIGMRLVLQLAVEDEQVVVTEIRQERKFPEADNAREPARRDRRPDRGPGQVGVPGGRSTAP